MWCYVKKKLIYNKRFSVLKSVSVAPSDDSPYVLNVTSTYSMNFANVKVKCQPFPLSATRKSVMVAVA